MGQSFGSDGKEWKELARSVSVLLSNRAQAHLQLGNLSAAVVDAAAAKFIDPTYQKAAYKLVHAYSRWQQTSPCTDNTFSLTASALASTIGRIWPSFVRTPLFRSLRSKTKNRKLSEPRVLWWEESDFIQILCRMKPLSPVSRSDSWNDIKAEANKHFNSKRFDLARDGYSIALQHRPKSCDWFVDQSLNFAANYGESDPPMAIAIANTMIVLRVSLARAWGIRGDMMKHGFT